MKGMACLKGNLTAHTSTWLHRGFALCAFSCWCSFLPFWGILPLHPGKWPLSLLEGR